MSDEPNKAMVPTPLMKIDDVVIQGRYNEDEHFRHCIRDLLSPRHLARSHPFALGLVVLLPLYRFEIVK